MLIRVSACGQSARVICRRRQRGKGDEWRDGTDRGGGGHGGNGSGSGGNKKVRKKPRSSAEIYESRRVDGNLKF